MLHELKVIFYQQGGLVYWIEADGFGVFGPCELRCNSAASLTTPGEMRGPQGQRLIGRTMQDWFSLRLRIFARALSVLKRDMSFSFKAVEVGGLDELRAEYDRYANGVAHVQG